MMKRVEQLEVTSVEGWTGVEDVDSAAGLEVELAVSGGDALVSVDGDPSDEEILSAVREKIALLEADLATLRRFVAAALRPEEDR